MLAEVEDGGALKATPLMITSVVALTLSLPSVSAAIAARLPLAEVVTVCGGVRAAMKGQKITKGCGQHEAPALAAYIVRSARRCRP